MKSVAEEVLYAAAAAVAVLSNAQPRRINISRRRVNTLVLVADSGLSMDRPDRTSLWLELEPLASAPIVLHTRRNNISTVINRSALHAGQKRVLRKNVKEIHKRQGSDKHKRTWQAASTEV